MEEFFGAKPGMSKRSAAWTMHRKHRNQWFEARLEGALSNTEASTSQSLSLRIASLGPPPSCPLALFVSLVVAVDRRHPAPTVKFFAGILQTTGWTRVNPTQVAPRYSAVYVRRLPSTSKLAAKETNSM